MYKLIECNPGSILFACCLILVATQSAAEFSSGQHKPINTLEPILLNGVVFTDAPIVGANVVVKCASENNSVSVKTDTSGKYSVKANNSNFPCVLEAAGGRVDGAENALKLHSVAYQSGLHNITPISELSLAHAAKRMPDALFDSPVKPLFPAELDVSQGLVYVKKQLNLTQLGLLPDNLSSKELEEGDAVHQVLRALMEKVALSQHSLKDLVEIATKREDWHGVLTAPPNTWKWRLPSTLPEPKVPDNNPMSDAKIELGRYLFYDVRLSGNKKFSCSSCHLQNKAFTDGKAMAVGSTGQLHPRSSPSLGNAAYNARLTWANPTEQQLEEQIDVPLFGMHPIEMGVNDQNKQEVIQRIQLDTFYQNQFKLAFPGQDNVIRWANIKKAISTFQRTLLTGNSRYDRHLRREKGIEWSPAEQSGYTLFFTSAKCFVCHGSFNFNDADTFRNGPPPDIRFHNTGLFNIGGTGAFPEKNRGVFEFTKDPSDMGKFRAPSLRNIAVTAPYMHDGSIPTLEKVLDFYATHGRNIKKGPYAGDGRLNPYKSKEVDEIHLNEKEKADIIAFLKTLTDEQFLKNPRLADPFKQ
ncbi:MAG TPA: di-heme enzyme [Methylophilus sp.]|mgnify:CR=1 FL=1|nr:di-heme enzyme [Methylophilus sp.]HQQ33239.1 di-heme enzyme [Methylophilus sp.]